MKRICFMGFPRGQDLRRRQRVKNLHTLRDCSSGPQGRQRIAGGAAQPKGQASPRTKDITQEPQRGESALRMDMRPFAFAPSGLRLRSAPFRGLAPSTCLATYFGQCGVVGEVVDEVAAGLVVGCAKAGEDFPASTAAVGFIAAREFAGDDGWPQ